MSASSAGSCTPTPSTARRSGGTLWEAGRPHGLVAGGYRAIDALRLEKGYRVWSSDITPDETPFEAGLGFAVALDKEAEFIGRDALVAAKAAGPRKRLRCLVLDDPRSVCLGNEPVRVDGEIVGRVTSGGYGFAVERSIAVRLPAAGRAADRDARRGRGVRRLGRLRGRARAAVRPRRCEDPVMSDASGRGLRRRTGRRSLRRGTDAELRGWLDVALAACDEADLVARRHFRRDLQIATKPDRTFVTQADTADRADDPRAASSTRSRTTGSSARSTAPRPATRRSAGTSTRSTAPTTSSAACPLFGTLLAVERDGELQAAVLSAPALDERWWAWRGGGAWARNRGEAGRAGSQVSGVTTLADAQVLYGSGRDIDASGRAPGFPAVLDAAWRERGFGDFWGYALLAEGAAEAMVEVDLSTWDAAAPMLLIEEAGGRVTDLEGRRAVDSGTFLASNGRLHEVVRQGLLEG